MGVSQSIPLGFPDKLLTKVRYHDTEPLNSSSGVIATYKYRWNSTFDPDSSGVGHQPLYRDTFAAIYDQYAVVRAHATIKFINTSTVPIIVGCVTDDDSTTSSSRDVLCEQTHGRNIILSGLNGALTEFTFHLDWDCKTRLNIDPFTSQTYKTAVGSNPSEESYLSLWSLPLDGSSASTSYVDVLIEYTTLFTELTTPTVS